LRCRPKIVLSSGISYGFDEGVDDDRGIADLALPENVVRQNPIVAPKIDGDDRSIEVVICKPLDEAIVECPMRVKEEKAGLSVFPVVDVLADQAFQELRLADAGSTANVEMLFASVTGKDERFPAPYYLAEFKVAWNHSPSSDTLGSVQKQARPVSDTAAR
jgi:hypothetical protein